jgi:hypothetical protein
MLCVDVEKTSVGDMMAVDKGDPCCSLPDGNAA